MHLYITTYTTWTPPQSLRFSLDMGPMDGATRYERGEESV